jgi:hypothetical protein
MKHAGAQRLNACSQDRLSVLIVDASGNGSGADQRKVSFKTLTVGEPDHVRCVEGTPLSKLLGDKAALGYGDTPLTSKEVAHFETTLLVSSDEAVVTAVDVARAHVRPTHGCASVGGYDAPSNDGCWETGRAVSLSGTRLRLGRARAHVVSRVQYERQNKREYSHQIVGAAPDVSQRVTEAVADKGRPTIASIRHGWLLERLSGYSRWIGSSAMLFE